MGVAVEQPGGQADAKRNKLSKQDLLLEDVKSKALVGESKAGRKPRILVIGALGRCGRGAVDHCK